MSRKKEQGFTLIELLIVVAIIGILAAIAIPQFGKYKASAARSAATASIKQCLTEMTAAYAAGATDAELTDLGVNHAAPAAWTRPCLIEAGPPAITFEVAFNAETGAALPRNATIAPNRVSMTCEVTAAGAVTCVP